MSCKAYRSGKLLTRVVLSLVVSSHSIGVQFVAKAWSHILLFPHIKGSEIIHTILL